MWRLYLVRVFCLFAGCTFLVEANGKPCNAMMQEDRRVSNLCQSEYFNSRGESLGAQAASAHQTDCETFFARHPEAIEYIGRVVVVDQGDLATEKMGKLMSGDTVSGRRLLQEWPYCGVQKRDNNGKQVVIADQDGNPKRKGTLVFFPASISDIVLEQSIRLKDCHAFYHPASDNNDQEKLILRQSDSLNAQILVANPSDSMKFVAIDGFTIRKSTASLDQYMLAIQNTSGLFLRNVLFDRNEPFPDNVFLRVWASPGGQLTLKDVRVDCRDNPDSSYTCLEVACNEYSGCPNTRVSLSGVNIQQSEEASSNSGKALTVSGINEFTIDDLQITGSVTNRPVYIGLNSASEINGCLSNMFLNNSNARLRFGYASIPQAGSADGPMMEEDPFGTIGLYRNGYLDENNNELVSTRDALLVLAEEVRELLVVRTMDCLTEKTSSSVVELCPSTTIAFSGSTAHPEITSSLTAEYLAEPGTTEYLAKPSTAGYLAETSTAGYLAETSTAGYLAETSTAGYLAEPSTAEYLTETSTAKYLAEPSTAGYLAETSTAGYLIEPSTAKYLAETSTAKYLAEPSTAKYLAEPSTAEYLAEPSTAKYLAETSTAKYLAEPSTAEYLAEPSTAKYLAETSTAKYLAGTSTAEYLAETSMAKYLAETSTAEYLAETSTAKYLAETSTAGYLIEPSTAEYLAETSTAKYLAETSTAEYLAETSTAEYLAETSTAEYLAETSTIETSLTSTLAQAFNISSTVNEMAVSVSSNVLPVTSGAVRTTVVDKTVSSSGLSGLTSSRASPKHTVVSRRSISSSQGIGRSTVESLLVSPSSTPLEQIDYQPSADDDNQQRRVSWPVAVGMVGGTVVCVFGAVLVCSGLYLYNRYQNPVLINQH